MYIFQLAIDANCLPVNNTMQVLPLAFDSLGSRSMATYIHTNDCKILIDPAVNLCALRDGYAPHPIEQQTMNQHWQKIKRYAQTADILIVSHYHFDHHNPEEPEVYYNKRVFLKHPQHNINQRQKERAEYLIKSIRAFVTELKYSDALQIEYGTTRLRFSDAVPHGSDDTLGYVTAVCISESDFKVLHTSDVQGACLDSQLSFIIEENPSYLILDGPLTTESVGTDILEGVKNIIMCTDVKKIIIDHHFLRDANWKKLLNDTYRIAESKNVQLLTAAEYLGVENRLLEAQRKELYQQFPINT